MNIHETLEEAAERESWEEACLKLHNIKYYKSYQAGDEKWGNYVAVYFIADLVSIGKIDTTEVSEIVWLSKEEIKIENFKQKDVIMFINDYFINSNR